MKSTDEPFDDELRGRLQRYTEEPNENLWQGIAPHVVSVNHEPGWVGWSQRISGAVVIGVTLMVGVLQYGVDKIDPNMFVTSLNHLQSSSAISQKKIGNEQGKIKEAATISTLKSTTSNNLSDENSSVNKEPRVLQKQNGPVNDISTVKAEPPSSEQPIEIFKIDQPYVPQHDLKNAGSTPSMIYNDTSKIISVQATESDTVPSAPKKKSMRRDGKRQKIYTLYFTAMPTFGYQRVESNQSDNIIIESIDKISAFSTDRLGLRVELGAEFPFLKSKKFKMFAGALYYQRKQTIGYTEKYLDSTLVSSGPSGEVIVEPQFGYVEKSIDYELKNIGIQLGFNYNLYKNKPAPLNSKKALSSKTIPFPVNKLSHVIGSGIEFHKALNKTNEFDKANGFSNPSAYVFLNVYYRLQYPSTGKLRGIFQPTFNYSFYINENLNAPFYVKPYGLGLNFGCTYNF